MISSLAIQKNLKGINFIIVAITQELLNLKMLGLLKIIKLVKVKKHAI